MPLVRGEGCGPAVELARAREHHAGPGRSPRDGRQQRDGAHHVVLEVGPRLVHAGPVPVRRRQMEDHVRIRDRVAERFGIPQVRLAKLDVRPLNVRPNPVETRDPGAGGREAPREPAPDEARRAGDENPALVPRSHVARAALDATLPDQDVTQSSAPEPRGLRP